VPTGIKLKHESELAHGAIELGVKYAEKRGAASQKLLLRFWDFHHPW